MINAHPYVGYDYQYMEIYVGYFMGKSMVVGDLGNFGDTLQ